MHGSAWPSVLPYCIFNVLNVLLVMYLKEKKGIDLTFSDRGKIFVEIILHLTCFEFSIADIRLLQVTLLCP